MAISLRQKKVKNEEEWIWVEGFKGTLKDMTCNDYQYELGKQHDMPEDAEIIECHSGFHFCRCLESVFMHYDIGCGHRFFKVKALVRKTDYENCYGYVFSSDKLVSKSIIFEREVTLDELFNTEPMRLASHDIPGGWTEELKRKAVKDGVRHTIWYAQVRYLHELGYSYELSKYICDRVCNYELAVALGTQTNISMDTRVNLLLKDGPQPKPLF